MPILHTVGLIYLLVNSSAYFLSLVYVNHGLEAFLSHAEVKVGANALQQSYHRCSLLPPYSQEDWPEYSHPHSAAKHSSHKDKLADMVSLAAKQRGERSRRHHNYVHVSGFNPRFWI